MSTQLHDAATWPRAVRQHIEAIAATLMLGLQLFRERAMNLGGSLAAIASSDAKDEKIRRLETELELHRRRFSRIPAKFRPHFAAEDRLAILRLAWLNGWSAQDVAQRLLLNVSTVRRWMRLWARREDPGVFFGKPAWNRLSDAVRDLIHDCRLQFVDVEIGTRTLAAQIRKAGVALSRATVQRVLREKPPGKPAPIAAKQPKEKPVKPFHILRPTCTNRVWHVDITQCRVLWEHFHIAAVLDGYSRKLLTVFVFKDSPPTAEMLKLLKATMKIHGKPRFIVCDHGGQFRKRFRKSVDDLGIALVQGRPHHPEFNGKVERLFKTFKLWQRVALLFTRTESLQAAIENFRNWYNSERFHQALSGLTPDEAWSGTDRPEPTRYLARSEVQPVFRIQRGNFGGDARLPVFNIRVVRTLKRSA